MGCCVWSGQNSAHWNVKYQFQGCSVPISVVYLAVCTSVAPSESGLESTWNDQQTLGFPKGSWVGAWETAAWEHWGYTRCRSRILQMCSDQSWCMCKRRMSAYMVYFVICHSPQGNQLHHVITPNLSVLPQFPPWNADKRTPREIWQGFELAHDHICVHSFCSVHHTDWFHWKELSGNYCWLKYLFFFFFLIFSSSIATHFIICFFHNVMKGWTWIQAFSVVMSIIWTLINIGYFYEHKWVA